MFEFAQALSPRLDDGYKFARSAVIAFFRWWIGELAAIAPKGFIGLMVGRRRAVVLVRGENLLLETEETPEQNARALVFTNGRPDPSVIEELKSSGAVILEFPEVAVAFRKVRLPRAAMHKAREAIGFLLPRLTPFQADEVYYAIQFERNDLGRKEAVFELAILPKGAVEAVRARLNAMGVDVQGVWVPRVPPSRSIEFPDAIGSSRGHRDWLQNAWRPVAVAALITAVFGPVVVAAILDLRAGALVERAHLMSRDAEAYVELRAELSKYENETAFLRARTQAIATSYLLETLAASIPDDTWIFSVELNRTAATIRGQSADVAGLLKKLASAPFSTPELIGSITHTQSDGKDRFELRLPIGSGS